MMVWESHQNVILIQIDASSFAEFEISEFEIQLYNMNVNIYIFVVFQYFKPCYIISNLKLTYILGRAPDKVRISISKMHFSSPNPMFDHLLESSHRDDSNKWSNIGFGVEITKVESIKVNFKHLIWSPAWYIIFLFYYIGWWQKDKKCPAFQTYFNCAFYYSV